MTKHLPALDGIRGVAILLVLFAHLLPYSPNHSLANRLLNGAAGIGWSGVSLFFVLSGFLITGILYEARQRAHYFLNFYARRTLRIFPLYFLLVTVSIVVLPLLFGFTASRPVTDRWMYWCYISNWHDSFRRGALEGWVGQLWSLAVEEHFYLLWPLVILLLSRVAAMRVCIVCILLANLFRVWFVLHGNLFAPYFFTFCRMDDLAIGSLLALTLKGAVDTSWLRTIAIRIVMVVAPLVAVLAVWKHGVIFTPTLLLAGLPLVGLLFTSLLALAVMPGSAAWTALMSLSPLRTFGKYSYGLYMYHPAVGALMIHLSLLPKGIERRDDVFRTLLMISATFIVSFVSYHLFEQNFLKLKRYFGTEDTQPRASKIGCASGAATKYESALEIPLS